MVVDNVVEAESGVKDGHNDATATFGNENNGHNLTPGITTDKNSSTDIAQSNICDKEDGTTTEGKDENLGDVHHDITNSTVGDVKKAASDSNNDQMDSKRPVEEQNSQARMNTSTKGTLTPLNVP